MKRYSPGPLLLFCLLTFSGSIAAQGSGGAGRFVISSGQEELIGRMLNIEPSASSGWWFKSAQIPNDAIVAVFERLGEDDPRMKSPPPAEAFGNEEQVVLETIRLRLIHPRDAPAGSVATARFALTSHGEAGARSIPADLLEPLLSSLRLEEDGFIWHETRGHSSGETHGRLGVAAAEEPSAWTPRSKISGFFSSVSGRWALSAAFVAVTLGLVAAGHWLFLLRRRRTRSE